MDLLYNIAIHFYTGAIRLAALFNPKARKWIHGRRGLIKRIKTSPRPEGRLVWFHCASLGEFEQGRPIIEKLRQNDPAISVLLTFFSPSGYEVRKTYNHADLIYYLPADTRANARAFVDHLQPDAAVFIKYEFWKNYLDALYANNIPVFSVSAIFRPKQLFFRKTGKGYRKLLRRFTHIFTQDSPSAELLRQYGINQCSVSGDTRFDRVAKVATSIKNIPEVEAFKANKLLFVAGSTWPEDEALLSGIIREFSGQIKSIVAPHEVHINRIRQIERQLSDVKTIRYSQIIPEKSLDNYDVLIIDNVGLLSAIYAYAAIAYVGGGFKTGLHNILEPATFGIPVIFGPKYSKFKEANDLTAQQGAFSISTRQQLQQLFATLVNDAEYRQNSGAICKRYIAQHTGATETIIKELEKVLY